MLAFPLVVWPERWAVCRLAADAAVPAWARAPGRLVAVVRTDAELTLVVPADRVPEGTTAACDFRVIQVVGPVPFSVVGLMAAITRPLAEAGVSIFTVATYDTDYILVREASVQAAVDALRAAGFRVT